MSLVTATEEQPTAPCLCGCGTPVKPGRMYRQGHDQRHLGALTRSVHAEKQTLTDAMAQLPTPELRAKLQAAYDRPTKAKREPGVKNSTKAKVAAVTGETAAIRAKVGRWTYEGTVRNGDFVYASKKDGSPVRVAEGKYTIVD